MYRFDSGADKHGKAARHGPLQCRFAAVGRAVLAIRRHL